MPKLLRALGGAATVYGGIVAGQEAEHARQRKRTLEERTDSDYTEIERPRKLREAERGDIEHGELKRNTEEEAGARAAARRAAEEVPTNPAPAARTLEAAPGDQGGTADAQPLPPAQGGDAEAGAMPVRTLSMAQPQQPVNATPAGAPSAPEFRHEAGNKALWARTAEAQRDYWTKRGKPERGAKVMAEAINMAIAEREAKHKFETLPKIEALRSKGLANEELAKDQQFIDLRRKAAENDVFTAGLMWGHVLSGNKQAAIDAFNASGVTLPGMQIADLGQTADGKKIFLLDKDGQIAKDKQGKQLVYQRQLLDNLHAQAQSSTITLNKGQTVVQVKKGPGGAMEAKPIVTAPDPEAERKDKREERAAGSAENTRRVREDKAWGEAINKARDDGDRLMRNAYMITTNPITGSVSGNVGKYRRAAKILEDKLAAVRQSGLRVDQVRANSLANEAMDEADDQLKREAMGATKRDRTRSASQPGAGPTWRDMLQ